MRRKRTIAVVGFLIFVGAVVFVSFKTGPPARPDFLRDEAKLAAYSNVVAVAHGVREDGWVTVNAAMSRGELVRLVGETIEAPDYAYRTETHPMADLAAVKGFAQAIVAKGKDAEGRGRYREAADDYVSVLELGLNFEHGPLIYFLVGAAIEQLGLRPLKSVIPNISNEDIAPLARRIQSINRNRISMREVLRREEYFGAKNATNVAELVSAVFSRSRRAALAKARKIHSKNETDCEGVAGAAATLVYQRENLRALTNVEALVPKFLAHVPQDGFGDGAMRLLALPGGPVIYSVGENRHDEQGRGDDVVFSFGDVVASERSNVSRER